MTFKKKYMKIISHCYNCPYYSSRMEGGWLGRSINYCALAGKKFDYKTDGPGVTIIYGEPDWCPLEDVE